jgi:hypothetical protein
MSIADFQSYSGSKFQHIAGHQEARVFDGLHLLRQESINVPNRRLDMPLVVIAYRFEFSIEKALSAVTIAPEGKSCRIPKRL